MKPLHEIGFIKSGNKRTGVVLKKGIAEDFTEPFIIGDMNAFIKSVKDNKVQYFVWNEKNNNFEVRYTEEEKRHLDGSGVEHYIGEDYYKHDISFKQKWIDLMYKGVIYVKVLACNQLPIIDEYTSIVLFGRKELIQKEYERLKRLFDRTYWSQVIRFGGNHISMQLSLNDLMSTEVFSSDGRYVIDTSEVDRLSKLAAETTVNIMGGVTEVDNERIKKLENYSKRFNEKSENNRGF